MSWNGNDPDLAACFRLRSCRIERRHFLVMDRSRGHGRNAILDSKNESFIDVPDVEELEIIPDGSGFVARDTVAQKSWDDSLFFARKLDASAIEKLCRESLWYVDLNGTRHGMKWDESAIRRAVALYARS